MPSIVPRAVPCQFAILRAGLLMAGLQPEDEYPCQSIAVVLALHQAAVASDHRRRRNWWCLRCSGGSTLRASLRTVPTSHRHHRILQVCGSKDRSMLAEVPAPQLTAGGRQHPHAAALDSAYHCVQAIASARQHLIGLRRLFVLSPEQYGQHTIPYLPCSLLPGRRTLPQRSSLPIFVLFIIIARCAR